MAEFAPKTSYELLKKAKSETEGDSLAKTVENYRPFILFICQKHLPLNKSQIEDVAHDFITTRMISGNVVNGYDPIKGVPFNAYLRKCVANYCKSFVAREANSLNEFEIKPDEFHNESDIVSEEDTVWARTIFANAVRDLKCNCREEGKEHLWRAFHDQILAPAFLGTVPKSPDDFGVDQQTLSNWQVTGYRKLRRFVKHQVKSLGVKENLAMTTGLIVELLKTPLANEPIVQQLLSKTFHDDEVSRIFLSDGGNASIKGLDPSSTIGASSLQRRWIELLQMPLERICNGNKPSSGQLFTVDEVIFDERPQFAPLRVSLQKAAKKKIERSMNGTSTDLDGRIYFAIYTLAICSEMVNDQTRTTTLNTLQISHNIQNCQATEWLDEDCQRMLQQALDAMEND